MKFKPGDLIRNIRTEYTTGDGPIYLVLSATTTELMFDQHGDLFSWYELLTDEGIKDRMGLTANHESAW